MSFLRQIPDGVGGWVGGSFGVGYIVLQLHIAHCSGNSPGVRCPQRARTHTYTHTHIRTYTHTHIHTYTHTHIHTTHTHRPIPSQMEPHYLIGGVQMRIPRWHVPHPDAKHEKKRWAAADWGTRKRGVAHRVLSGSGSPCLSLDKNHGTTQTAEVWNEGAGRGVCRTIRGREGRGRGGWWRVGECRGLSRAEARGDVTDADVNAQLCIA